MPRRVQALHKVNNIEHLVNSNSLQAVFPSATSLQACLCDKRGCTNTLSFLLCGRELFYIDIKLDMYIRLHQEGLSSRTKGNMSGWKEEINPQKNFSLCDRGPRVEEVVVAGAAAPFPAGADGAPVSPSRLHHMSLTEHLHSVVCPCFPSFSQPFFLSPFSSGLSRIYRVFLGC